MLNLSVGEPDFPMPELAREYARKTIEEGRNRYTDVTGIPELRERIQRKLAEDNDLDYAPGDIVVANGAKHALFNAFLALCGERDEVIVPAPYWVTYPEQVRLTGAEPVIAPTGEGFTLTADLLETVVTPQTKAVVLNSPANPTGATYSKPELEALAEVVLRHDLYVVEDLIYEYFHYGDSPVPSIASLGPELQDRTVIVNGVSNSCAMTGWRVGYTAAPQAITQLIRRLQGQATSNVSIVAQYAAIGAMDSVPWAEIKSYRPRRDLAHHRLASISGVRCAVPAGAFYLFPNVAELLGDQCQTSDEFCAQLLADTGVGLVPGSGFGAPDHIRLSYAVDVPVLEAALDRLAEFAAN
ncbi:pyridoxal phosphate-dependent aminotransferase [Amycolatopsis alkalitolerans]|uniref:pyridoxal phosphate-dependent aminotransferase n=1 Tax=Amycolatopsis alkalitolerans TaxID=2547244 RepID=UPI00190F7DBC|nr:pyridoxal phosphate-dependent aminotransferase [Amycolatopsis alkalitolerans]